MSTGINQDVRRLLEESIDSIRKLDVLLCMREAGVDRSWTVAELNAKLRSSETALEAAAVGRRIHNSLLRFQGHLSVDFEGRIVFPNQNMADAFNREVETLQTLGARLDSLDAASTERARADLARLEP